MPAQPMPPSAHILIVAHAPLAGALLAGVCHAFEDAAACVHAYDVPPSQSPETTRGALQDILKKLPHQTPLLLVSDVLGATPCNVAQRLAEQLTYLQEPTQKEPSQARTYAAPVKLLAGANLPMLLRAYSYRHLPLDELAAKALQGATTGVVDVPCGGKT